MQTTVALAAVSPAANTLNGQGWKQLGELGLALLLSAAIGLERELRQKDAGLRTHTLVGVGSALFMLISKYGFTDVLEKQLVVLDPSRVAAQIVSGIGFIGAGLIFVHRGSVRGLTTAASIWVTAAVGAAAGAGLAVLAAVTTGIYFVVTLGFPILRRHLPSVTTGTANLQISYSDGRGVLRRVLNEATERGFAIDDLATEPEGYRSGDGPGDAAIHRGQAATDQDTALVRIVTVTMHVHGRHPVGELIAALSDLDHVDSVVALDINDTDD
jgi:putative Mg2+ transporter-C (MgtC) family protein